MPLLTDFDWRIKYDPDEGTLIEQFYLTALACAQRYDRTTGYFSATALAIAARGVEGEVPDLAHVASVQRHSGAGGVEVGVVHETPCGNGGARICCPRPKVSMTTMAAPQSGHTKVG